MSNKSIINITKPTRQRLEAFAPQWFTYSNEDELINDMITELERYFNGEEPQEDQEEEQEPQEEHKEQRSNVKQFSPRDIVSFPY